MPINPIIPISPINPITTILSNNYQFIGIGPINQDPEPIEIKKENESIGFIGNIGNISNFDSTSTSTNFHTVEDNTTTPPMPTYDSTSVVDCYTCHHFDLSNRICEQKISYNFNSFILFLISSLSTFKDRLLEIK